MILRLFNSIKYRATYGSGPVFKKLVHFLKLKAVQPKPVAGFCLVTLTGAAQADLCVQSLWSLYRSATQIPSLRVVTDGTIDAEALKNKLFWWPGNPEILEWKTFAEQYLHTAPEELLRFAATTWMGKKVGVILGSALNEATLFADTDLLWYRNIGDFINPDISVNKKLMLASDRYYAYDEHMLDRHIHIPLRQLPPLNTGLVFVTGNWLNDPLLIPLLKTALEHSNHFTEQTMLALLSVGKGEKRFFLEDVPIFDEGDQFALLPTYLGKKWMARHYVGQIRHLFWKDLLALKLGIKP